MNDEKKSQKIEKEELKKFIEEYIFQYRKILEEKYPQRKENFPFYSNYPLNVIAYVSEISTYIVYKSKASSLKIEVFEVDDIPDQKKQKEDIESGVYSNDYLKYLMRNPREFAEMEISNLLSYEEREKAQDEYYEALFEEYIESEVDNYIKYLNKARDVETETSKKNIKEIHSAIKLAEKHLDNHRAFLKTGCMSLLYVVFDLNQDIESSIFLSIHGKYRPANALLRRWLETTLIALCFDFKLKNCVPKTKTYEELQKECNEWLEKSSHFRFTGKNRSILATLLDSDTDNFAMQILNEGNPSKFSSFNEYIAAMFGNLSKCVHYGGMNDDILIDFAEYNEKNFKEWYVILNQINEICNILILLKFPEMLTLSWENKNEKFHALKEKQIQKLKELLKIE
ncbi:MAG: hypothetical protein WC556_08165 [Candidatus Methanoperedens sp.]